MDFNSYLQRKQLLQKNILTILILLDDLQLRHAQKRLHNVQHNLEDEKFTVVVIGEFSRGKSTFVNAMLGKSILPFSKRPTTNIISKIIYGMQPSYTIYYKNGERKNISDKEFLDIKAQAEVDPSDLERVKMFFKKTEDFSKIDFAEIAYPLSFCQNNVEVVDTPGTNDLNVGRMGITYRYLENAEAAILLLAADQALTKSEKKFLRDRVLGNQIKDIFIVINYKDVLNGPAEEEKVKQYVLDNLADLGNFEQRIFMVSSKQALSYRRKENGETLTAKTMLSLPKSIEETGFIEFETVLGHFLSEEKGRAKLNKYVNCCNVALTEIEACLSTRREAISHSADELRARLHMQRPKFEQAKAEAIHITQRLRSKLLLEESNLEQKADIAANRIKQAAIEAVNEYRDGMSSQDVQYLIDKAITPIEKQLISDVNALQSQIIDDEINHAVSQLQRIWKDMDFTAESLPITHAMSSHSNIDTDIRGGNRDIDVILTTAGSFLVGSLLVLNPLAGVLALAAGWRWFSKGGTDQFLDKKALIKEQVRKQYNVILEGFSLRIAQQYHSTVDEICNSMQNEINTRLDTMEQQLQSLISAKESKERDAENEIYLLKQQFAEVRRIRSSQAEVIK